MKCSIKVFFSKDDTLVKYFTKTFLLVKNWIICLGYGNFFCSFRKCFTEYLGTTDLYKKIDIRVSGPVMKESSVFWSRNNNSKDHDLVLNAPGNSLTVFKYNNVIVNYSIRIFTSISTSLTYVSSTPITTQSLLDHGLVIAQRVTTMVTEV